MSHTLSVADLTLARPTRHGPAARRAPRLAASLMLLAAIGTVLPPPAHHEPAPAQAGDHDLSGHGPTDHEHPALPAQPHQAGSAAGLAALWSHARSVAHDAWTALRAPERCSDCSRQAGAANLAVGGGCRCDCYSGGYNPDDPACSW